MAEDEEEAQLLNHDEGQAADGDVNPLSTTSTTSPAILLIIMYCFDVGLNLIVVDAYDLAKSLGHDAGDSGFAIGIFMAGMVLGSVAMWNWQNHYAHRWRDKVMPGLFSYFVFNIVGGGLYLVVCTVSWTHNKAVGWGLLIASRVIQGIGEGMLCQFLPVLLTRLTPPPERPRVFMLLNAACCMGLGIGPLLAVLGHVVEKDVLGYTKNVFVGTAVLQLVLYASVGGWLWCVFPRLDQEASRVETYALDAVDDGGADALKPSSLSDKQRITLICSALFCATCRAFTVAGIETGEALLLETKSVSPPSGAVAHPVPRCNLPLGGVTLCSVFLSFRYGYSARAFGMILAATLIASVPIAHAVERVEDVEADVERSVTVLGVVAFIGSVLLFTVICEPVGHGSCPYFLISANVLVLPFLYLADGLVSGTMMKEAFPQVPGRNLPDWSPTRLCVWCVDFRRVFSSCCSLLFSPSTTYP